MFDKEKIKELYPGAEDYMFEPMLIHNATDEQLRKVCNLDDYFGQIKVDGALYIYVKGDNGKSYLFGRTISKKTGLLTEKGANVPHIMSALDDFPNGTVILGEIYYPNKSSRNVVEIMGCLPEKAIARQNGDYGLISYYIYDILAFDKINFITAQTTNDIRYKILNKLYFKYHFDNKYGDYLHLAAAWSDNLYERIGSALSDGEEGMVIKKKDGIYEPGKRPMTNLKAKQVDFADVVIIDFESPTVEYYGKEIKNWEYWVIFDGDKVCNLPIGQHYGEENVTPVTKPFYMGWNNARIQIGAYNNKQDLIKIGTIHSGISDEMKQDMSENPDKYIGKVCSIQCMEKNNQDCTIRHGFFKHMREDKDAKDCTLSTIF